ncbi:hypothetical protein BJ508DRAFT_412638 [Ascobolus immersus RN42]|uniref:Protein N-terminal and lysine N-methyltransferase EFM7 n=1 Tax=Ascobolus immersus RN42 TaxID=1160509 RepID=A0A3N4IKB3_ASCIM|nr:hypothetical protein BJ508DRAFT_412638 [Ascobolus immersus RN42]
MTDSAASSPPGSPTFAIFQEPEDWRPKTPPPHTDSYTLQDGRELELRLVGQNPLWGHMLWNAGRILARYIEENPSVVQGKTVLELGAGAGLPGVVAGIAGAEKVVITDFPDPDLITNIRHNLTLMPAGSGAAEGYAWGKEQDHLLAHLPSGHGDRFDVVLMADLLFNHKEHPSMVRTLKRLLRVGTGRAYVFFTPHRTWLYHEDLNFFSRVKAEGGEVKELGTWKMKEMFIEDKGDPELKSSVFGFEVRWPEGWTPQEDHGEPEYVEGKWKLRYDVLEDKKETRGIGRPTKEDV